ncbi:MAG: hypothetical protein HY674_00700 [Chloroflexi bacterium]|nr:hypothetical protein [Chloroflexota bacterium]
MSTNPSALLLPAPSQASNSVAELDIRPVKAPVAIPTGWAWLWWTLGALVLGAVLYRLWRYWQKKRHRPAPEIIIPPHRRARERLRGALALLDQPEPFCVLVSDVIRQYLEERFELHAPDRTTEEFLGELQFNPVLSPTQKLSLGDFLGRCDLVKFARYDPAQEELKALYDAAMRLVDETEPKPALPPPPGPGAAPEPQPAAPALESPPYSNGQSR